MNRDALREKPEKSRDKRVRYTCGCEAVEDTDRSNANWKAYVPRCSEHGERLDFTTIVQ